MKIMIIITATTSSIPYSPSPSPPHTVAPLSKGDKHFPSCSPLSISICTTYDSGLQNITNSKKSNMFLLKFEFPALNFAVTLYKLLLRQTYFYYYVSSLTYDLN